MIKRSQIVSKSIFKHNVSISVHILTKNIFISDYRFSFNNGKAHVIKD